MKGKDWLLVMLGALLCGAVAFASPGRCLGDDGFYVIPVGNPNIKMVEENTAVGKGHHSSGVKVSWGYPRVRTRHLLEMFQEIGPVERAGIGRRRIFMRTSTYGKSAPHYTCKYRIR